MLESGAPLEEDAAEAEGGGRGGAAGGAVRGAGAVVGERQRAVRRGAPALRRVPDRRRRARGRSRDRTARCCSRRTSRSRSSASSRRGSRTSRKHAGARRAEVWIGAATAAAGSCRVSDDGVGFDGRRTPRGSGAEEHAPAGGDDRAAASRSAPSPAAARPSRSCCAPRSTAASFLNDSCPGAPASASLPPITQRAPPLLAHARREHLDARAECAGPPGAGSRWSVSVSRRSAKRDARPAPGGPSRPACRPPCRTRCARRGAPCSRAARGSSSVVRPSASVSVSGVHAPPPLRAMPS